MFRPIFTVSTKYRFYILEENNFHFAGFKDIFTILKNQYKIIFAKDLYPLLDKMSKIEFDYKIYKNRNR